MTQNILEIQNLTKDFSPTVSFSQWAKFNFSRPAPTRALSDISFPLERGKILGILGPNGAGKTTLLKIIATLILPNKGQIALQCSAEPSQSVPLSWSHQGFTDPNSEALVKSNIGLMIDEERSFYWRLTGRQNLEFFSALYGLSPAQTKKGLTELFSWFGIDYGDKAFASYSTGMKKRFALMRGLLHNPTLLLLDEPTKSLDYPTTLKLKEFIKNNLVRTAGKTVILTTHNLDENLDFCDLFLILVQGKIKAFGSLAQLRQQTSNPNATVAEIFLHFTREA